MKVVTFYADCDLPPAPKAKSAGFDWHRAIRDLERTARSALGAQTVLVTDERTQVQKPALRVGNAKETGIMLWLLDAQAEAIRTSREERLVMISPDTLLAGPLDALFGEWDACLLTRTHKVPLLNSVIAVRPSAKLAALWAQIAFDARFLPPSAHEWGADVEALVSTFSIRSGDNRTAEVNGCRIRLQPIHGLFRSVDLAAPASRLREPIWDFKGARKARMPDYAALL